MVFNFDALVDILRCPKSHSELVQDADGLISVDPSCRLRYPIRDDIPCLIVEDARQLSSDEWRAAMQRHQRDPETGRKIGGG